MLNQNYPHCIFIRTACEIWTVQTWAIVTLETDITDFRWRSWHWHANSVFSVCRGDEAHRGCGCEIYKAVTCSVHHTYCQSYFCISSRHPPACLPPYHPSPCQFSTPFALCSAPPRWERNDTTQLKSHSCRVSAQTDSQDIVSSNRILTLKQFGKNSVFRLLNSGYCSCAPHSLIINGMLSVLLFKPEATMDTEVKAISFSYISKAF